MQKIVTAIVVMVAAMTLGAFSISADNQAAFKKSIPANKMEQTTQKDITATIHTTLGDIKIRLYGDTPKHQLNFLKLAKEGFYDGLLFHRVINEFMVQGGDPTSRNAPKGKMLGMGDPDYRIDAEFVYPKHFHKRGALAAAREGDATNPERKSSGSQFYIVTGKKFTDSKLDTLERAARQRATQDIFGELAKENRDSIMNMRRNRDTEGLQALQQKLAEEAVAREAANPAVFTTEQRKAYTTEGGTPHLDGSYTVFGEVVDGMDVVDRIQQAETDRNDRPTTDIAITGITIDND